MKKIDVVERALQEIAMYNPQSADEIALVVSKVAESYPQINNDADKAILEIIVQNKKYK